MSKIPARRRAIMSTLGPEWHDILFFRSIQAPTRERYLRSADSSGCVKRSFERVSVAPDAPLIPPLIAPSAGDRVRPHPPACPCRP